MTASWTNNIIGPWTAWAAIHLLGLKCKMENKCKLCASVFKIYCKDTIVGIKTNPALVRVKTNLALVTT
jgi:hypothetical protein